MHLHAAAIGTCFSSASKQCNSQQYRVQNCRYTTLERARQHHTQLSPDENPGPVLSFDSAHLNVHWLNILHYPLLIRLFMKIFFLLQFSSFRVHVSCELP